MGYFFFFLGGAEAAESARCFLDASIASSCACRIVCHVTYGNASCRVILHVGMSHDVMAHSFV